MTSAANPAIGGTRGTSSSPTQSFDVHEVVRGVVHGVPADPMSVDFVVADDGPSFPLKVARARGADAAVIRPLAPCP